MTIIDRTSWFLSMQRDCAIALLGDCRCGRWSGLGSILVYSAWVARPSSNMGLMPMMARPVESLGVKTADFGGFALGAVTYLTAPLTDMSEMAGDAHRLAHHINVPPKRGSAPRRRRTVERSPLDILIKGETHGESAG